eukprot:7998806-Pyramimonas_sp.AAC.1
MGLVSALQTEAAPGILLSTSQAMFEDGNPQFRSIPTRVRPQGNPECCANSPEQQGVSSVSQNTNYTHVDPAIQKTMR